MKTENAAGGVIVRLHNRRWEVLVLQDMNNSWTFPKGKIEIGENEEEAARREILEEVGISNLRVIERLPAIAYQFHKNGRVNKTVQYFLFASEDASVIVSQVEEGIHNAQWKSLDEAFSIIGYSNTNTALLEQTKQWISHQRRT